MPPKPPPRINTREMRRSAPSPFSSIPSHSRPLRYRLAGLVTARVNRALNGCGARSFGFADIETGPELASGLRSWIAPKLIWNEYSK